MIDRRQEYHELMAWLDWEIGPSSSHKWDTYHSFHKLVQMGPIIIPFIYEDMKIAPQWEHFALLRTITQCENAPMPMWGKLYMLANFYIKLCEDNGYVDRTDTK